MAVTPGYLDVVYTCSGSANAYSYNSINGVTGYTIQTGDHVEYDIQWVSGPNGSSNVFTAFDFSTSNGQTFRDSNGRVDERALSPHPSTSIGTYAANTWYHRKTSLTGLVGQYINNYFLANEADTAGSYRAFIREIKITDGHGNDRKIIYSNTDPAITSPVAPTTTLAYNIATTLTSVTAVAAATTTTAARPNYAAGYVLQDAPVGYWRLSDYTDAATPPYNLSTGGGNPGLNNAALLASDDAGTSASFSTNAVDFFTAGYNPSYNLSAITIVAWIQMPVSLSGQFHAVLGRMNTSSGVRDYNFYVWSQNNNGVYDSMHFSSANAGSSTYQGAIRINDGGAHMVAVTVGADGKQTYYLDGAQVGQSQQTANWSVSTSNPLWIGRADNYWVGQLSDVAVFGQVLTPAKIANYYTVGTGGVIAAASGGSVGGGGTGSGVGNLLGGFFFGETMLGGDQAAGSGSSGSGTGVGNMLGGFFIGETMLGGDQAAGAGGDPPLVSSGSVFSMGGAAAGRTTVAATAKLGVGLRTAGLPNLRTTVTAALTQSSLRAGYVNLRTTVTGRLSSASFLSVQAIAGRTTVTANMRKVVPPLSATPVNGRTTVTGTLTRSVLRGDVIFDSTFVVQPALSLNENIRVEGIRGSTGPITGRLGLARPYTSTSNISCGTTLSASLTYFSPLSGGNPVGKTTVTAALTRSFLRGAIAGKTTVTIAAPSVRSAYNGTIRTSTLVKVDEGGFKRTLKALVAADVQTIMAGTRVRGYTYVTPQDFVPIYLNTSTRVQGAIRLRLQFGSANNPNVIRGATVFRGNITGLQTMVGNIIGRTRVTGKAKSGFGGDANGFGYVSGAIGVRYLYTKARTGVITCRTVVIAGAPRNGTSGRAWGGTRFTLNYGTPDALIPYGTDYTYLPPVPIIGHYIGSDHAYDYLNYDSYYYGTRYYVPNLPTLGLRVAIKVETVKASTRLRSLVVPSRAYAHNRKGDPPYYGPYGSVSLYISPKGDIGLGDFIDGGTVIEGRMLALRHRLLQILSATGLEFPGQIVFTGDAVRGIGTRSVTSGTKAQQDAAQRKPVPQTVHYV